MNAKAMQIVIKAFNLAPGFPKFRAVISYDHKSIFIFADGEKVGKVPYSKRTCLELYELFADWEKSRAEAHKISTKETSLELEIIRHTKLFDVDDNSEAVEMVKNIGKTIKYILVDHKRDGLQAFEPHRIVDIQKDFKGDLVYRVKGLWFEDRFGRCAAKGDFVFVE